MWVSLDRCTKNHIFHIDESKKWKYSILDARNRRGADVYSNHYLLVEEIRIKLSLNIRQT